MVLFIQGLLLIDADLTDGVGRKAIGIGLLVVNLFLIAIILVGAHETVQRASAVGQGVGRRVQRGSIAILSRIAAAKMQRSGGSGMEVEVEVELSEVYGGGPWSDATPQETDGVVTNPMTAQATSNTSKQAVLAPAETTHTGSMPLHPPTPPPAPPQQASDSGWVQYTDPASGSPYWLNASTNESSWYPPAR